MRATFDPDEGREPAGPAARLTDEERDFAEANMGLVGFVVGGLEVGRGREDDAKQAGMLALMRAARGFDPSAGVRFSTYACLAIRRDVLRHLALDRLIHVPLHTQGLNGGGRDVAPALRAAGERAMRVGRVPISDDEPGSPPPFTIDPEPDPDDAPARVREAVAALPDVERDVIRVRMLGGSYVEAGRAIRASHDTARKVEQSAMGRLRAALVAYA